MSFFKNLFTKKEIPIRSYEDFWQWFQANEKGFFGAVKQRDNLEKDFFSKLSPKLDEIKEGIWFVTGMYDDNNVELIFTADGILKTIGFVEELVSSAPKIGGWIFTALKQPLDIKDVSISLGGYEFNADNINFYYNHDDTIPDEIDITIIHDDYNEENKGTITNGTYIFLDNLIGELNVTTTIDVVNFIEPKNTKKELIPIAKLKDYLIWRQKEFIEKYEGMRYNTGDDAYSSIEGVKESGRELIAVVNTDLLAWDSKASHPWILNVEIKYDGKDNNGFPDPDTFKLLDVIQDDIEAQLKDFDGYLNIGRQTCDNIREIYFACKDFRKPAKVLHNITKDYADKIEMDFDIYKDKYWQSFERFMNIPAEDEGEEDDDQ